MAISYSTLRKPVNPQVVDPQTGRMREEWVLYFQQLTTRVNAAVGELGSTFVNTSGTPVANDIARFTDADTIEGRSYAELKADLDLEIGTDVFTQRTITGTTGEIDVSNGNGISGNPTLSLDSDQTTKTLTFVIDGGGSEITTGVKGYVEIPFACTVTQATALADQSGSIVVDIWKDTYANYPPTDADSITASAPVTISTATKSQDATLTGWTTSISAGDILGFNVDSITTCTLVTISLTVSIP